MVEKFVLKGAQKHDVSDQMEFQKKSVVFFTAPCHNPAHFQTREIFMLLEEVGSTLWNLDLFQSARTKVETSVNSGWLKPICENFWDSATTGKVVKTFARIISFAIDVTLITAAVVGLSTLVVASCVHFCPRAISSQIPPQMGFKEAIREGFLIGIGCQMALEAVKILKGTDSKKILHRA